MAHERLEQFQQKCAAVSRPELRKNKEIEHFPDWEKNGNALAARRNMFSPSFDVTPYFPSVSKFRYDLLRYYISKFNDARQRGPPRHPNHALRSAVTGSAMFSIAMEKRGHADVSGFERNGQAREVALTIFRLTVEASKDKRGHHVLQSKGFKAQTSKERGLLPHPVIKTRDFCLSNAIF